MEDIKLEINQKDNWGVISLVGRLDRVNADEVYASGEKEMSSREKLAVELTGLEYISSAGIRVLLRLAKKAKAENKSFALCGAAGFVKEVLEDSNLDMLVTMLDSASQLS